MASLNAGYKNFAVFLQGGTVNGAVNAFVHNGPDALALTYTGSVTNSTAQTKFSVPSMAFPGGTNYAMIPASIAAMGFGISPWRITFWLYVSTFSSGIGIFSIGFGTGALLMTCSTSGAISANAGLGQPLQQLSASGALVTGVWQYVEFGRQGGNAYLNCYVGGVYKGQVSMATNANYPLPNAVSTVGYASAIPFTGFISDFIVQPGVAPGTVVPTDTWLARQPQVAGNVKDAAGAFAARRVRGYDRTTGALVGSTTSNATTGEYLLGVSTLSPITVLALPADGEVLNALALDSITPA